MLKSSGIFGAYLKNNYLCTGELYKNENMVKSYQRKRTREELLAGFKLAITKKREWLKEHNLKELTIAGSGMCSQLYE